MTVTNIMINIWLNQSTHTHTCTLEELRGDQGSCEDITVMLRPLYSASVHPRYHTGNVRQHVAESPFRCHDIDARFHTRFEFKRLPENCRNPMTPANPICFKVARTQFWTLFTTEFHMNRSSTVCILQQ